ERALRDSGTVPAVIALRAGKVLVGLEPSELEYFAVAREAAKVSRRDLAAVLAAGGDGATTVAATVACAALAGIPILATGGIGGVHRGGAESLDISADLTELARSPVAVVCAGAKSILDLPRTLQVLETGGVPVVGYGTGTFPAFYLRGSGLPLETRVDAPEGAARLIAAQRELGLTSGLVIAAPIPETAALDPAEQEAWLAAAEKEAEAAGIVGKALTPYLLHRLGELSGGRTLEANLALLENNARIAGEIAAALARM
ncbi:MAG TPA: pseudouridine-5'-phosphate glycosidase, partial [Kiloniellales bacterium]|nr:pseudouridine-5'-phosphate glycosidase [Kiloniellales bacterium]